MTLDYNKLRLFVTVAEHRSLTKAAGLMGRTQSAVSQSLKSLEDELGVYLLERDGGRVYPTPKGLRLYEKLKGVFEALDREALEVLDETQSLKDQAKLGVSSELYEYFVYPRIRSFLQRYPNFALEVVLDNDVALERKLLDGELDMAIITQFRHRSTFDVCGFAKFKEHLVGHRSYLARHRITKLTDIFNHPLYDYSEDFVCIGTWMAKNDSKLLPRLRSQRPVQIIKDHRLLKTALATSGLAMMPDYLIEDGPLKILFPKTLPMNVGVDLACRKKRQFSPLQQELFETLRDRSEQG